MKRWFIGKDWVYLNGDLYEKVLIGNGRYEWALFMLTTA